MFACDQSRKKRMKFTPAQEGPHRPELTPVLSPIALHTDPCWLVTWVNRMSTKAPALGEGLGSMGNGLVGRGGRVGKFVESGKVGNGLVGAGVVGAGVVGAGVVGAGVVGAGVGGAVVVPGCGWVWVCGTRARGGGHGDSS